MDPSGSGMLLEGGLLLSPEPDKSGRSPLALYRTAAANSQQILRNLDANSGGPIGSHNYFPRPQRLREAFDQQQHQPNQQPRGDNSGKQQANSSPPRALGAVPRWPLHPRGNSAPAGRTHGSPNEHDGGGSLLAYLINSGALGHALVADRQGRTRLRDGSVALQVDVMQLMNSDTQLGKRWLRDPKGALWDLMDELQSEGLSSSRCPRLWLRPTQVPVPCQPVDVLMAYLTQLSAVTHGPLQLPASSHLGIPVCCYGVVVAASSLSRRAFSRALVCHRCGMTVEVLDERGLTPGGGCDCMGNGCGETADTVPAAAMIASGDLQEELSRRVMVDVQDLWLAALGSGTTSSVDGVRGPGGRFIRLGSLRVTCEDDLTRAAKVGDVVRVVGIARLVGPISTGGPSVAALLRSAAVAEVEALSIDHINPLALWALPGGGGGGGLEVSRSRQPLQLLCDLLSRLLSRPVDPLVMLAMMASAVSVPVTLNCGGDVNNGPVPFGAVPGGGRQQLSLLMGTGAPSDPLVPRLLRAAAALLSPHYAVLAGTAASGALTDDPLMPRVQQSAARADDEGQAGCVVYGSVLLQVGNRGVVLVDAEQLTARQKTQLCDLLSRPVVSLIPGRPELSIPVTTTVWATACRRAAADGSAVNDPCVGGRRWGGRGVYGGGSAQVPGSCRGSWSGLDESRFDLVLEHPEGVDSGVVTAGAAAAADGPNEEYMRRALRAHVAAAALMSPPPQLTDAALDLLMRYYVSVRQSGAQVTQTEVLRILVRVALASARLHLRRQVLEEPDCVLAILLVERTLEARFGDTYMRLALPPFLGATWLGDDGEPGGEAMVGDSSDSVDAALRRMKGTLGRCLRGFTPIDSQGLMRSEDGGGSGGYGS